MRALVTVARLGSFSAAARELAVTPGMLSKQVKHLEDDLDVRLLHRTTRGVSLTDAGELYVDQAVDILQRIDDTETAVAALSAGPRGVLRLSCPPAFGTHVLTPVIAAFARRNPEVRVELRLEDEEPDLVAARLDLTFRLGALRDSSFVSKQVGSAPFVLCAAPAYLERCGRPVVPAELGRFNCILDASIQHDGSWEFVRDGKAVQQPVTGNFSSLSTEAVIEAACEGLGLAYVPRYAIVEELENGEVTALDLDGVEPISLPLYALYASRQHVTGKVRSFLDFFIAQVDRKAGRHGVTGRAVQ